MVWAYLMHLIYPTHKCSWPLWVKTVDFRSCICILDQSAWDFHLSVSIDIWHTSGIIHLQEPVATVIIWYGNDFLWNELLLQVDVKNLHLEELALSSHSGMEHLSLSFHEIICKWFCCSQHHHFLGALLETLFYGRCSRYNLQSWFLLGSTHQKEAQLRKRIHSCFLVRAT